MQNKQADNVRTEEPGNLLFRSDAEAPGTGIAEGSETTAQDIRDRLDDLSRELKEMTVRSGVFVIRNTEDLFSITGKQPTPKMLFSEFWFEGELCILFADTNLGKSILAVQIADSIARGVPIPHFKMEAEAMVTIYFDFELSGKQFEARYINEQKQHHPFSKNFRRAEIDAYAELGNSTEDFETLINRSLERAVVDTGATVLIIDNITYLGNETEKARNALPLMKHLKALKERYGLSILALAHTPKRDSSLPISRNDLQGSKMLMNFCDSAFAIGESNADTSLRYLKQIKHRYTESIYDADNVIVCQTTKPGNFLMFEFLNYAKESEHLKRSSDTEQSDLERNIKELMAAEPELGSFAIAKKLCTDHSKFPSFKIKVLRIIKRIGNNR